MQAKEKKGFKMAGKLGVAGALLLASSLAGSLAVAQVVGRCDNCHTMHNSQSNNTQVFAGSTPGNTARWNSGVLEGGTSTTAQAELLKTDCVGCHTNTGPETILNVNGNRIPIVYNTGGYPAQPLAGGNFFNVASNQTYGHNVAGISTDDTNFIVAPGGFFCGISCHSDLSLANPTQAISGVYGKGVENFLWTGCRGCHTVVAHHNENDPSYRFVGGHSPGVEFVDGGGTATGGVNPYEDPNWEQTPSAANHNFYRAPQDFGSTAFNDRTTIGAFCSGCHSSFHAMGFTSLGPNPNGGDDNTDNRVVAGSVGANPWMRHPTDVQIPNDTITNGGTEYAAILGTLAYNPTIPVARVDGTADLTLVEGDQVTCISCHRAHASDQPDAMRFAYDAANMSAHSYATDQTNGCFYCHSTKDM